MESLPKVSIVIVNWNGKEAVRRCLKSLERYEDVETLQVIVSDNGSTDGSLEMLAKEFPYVEQVVNGSNIGFAAGNNRGFDSARGEWLLILNPDMEFIEPLLDKLSSYMAANPDVGACGCMVLKPDGSFMKQCRRGYPDPVTAFYKVSGLSALFPGNAVLGRYFYSAIPPDRAMDVDALSGAFIMARTSVIKSLGGFSEDYFMYVEDVDLCQRIRRSGARVRYLPAQKIVHHGEACVNVRPPLQRKRFYHYHMTRSHLALYAKDMEREGSPLFYSLSFGLILLRYAALSIFFTFNADLFQHLAEFWRIHTKKERLVRRVT